MDDMTDVQQERINRTGRVMVALTPHQVDKLQLPANLAKTPWWELGREELATLLREEFNELMEELANKEPDPERITEEAADLANICVFIHGRYGVPEKSS